MFLEWTFCDLQTVKVDFLSSQNLLAATVFTKEVNHASTVTNISMKISIVKIVCK